MSSKFIYVDKKVIGDREQQQDDIFLKTSNDGERILCVVADGMGGHSGGQQASKCVIAAAKTVWKEKQNKIDYPAEKLLDTIVQTAYKMMLGYEEKGNISPRSTCVILLIKEDMAHYCHVGDSRLYHFRNHKLLDRTKDHSVVQMLVEMGEVKESEMGTHEDQGRLLKWIGGKNPPQATFKSVEIEENDQFLLCSDGLWEYISVSQMERTLEDEADLKKIAKSFINKARYKAKPKGDNISMILCNIPEAKNTVNWHVLIIGVLGLFASLLAFIYFNSPECH